VKVEAVTFVGGDGQRLAARLDRPNEEPSTSPVSARAKASSPTPTFPPMSHRLGGAAVLAAAVEVPESKAVVTIAAPSDARHVTGSFWRT